MGAQLLWLKNPMGRDEKRIGVETRRLVRRDPQILRGLKKENRIRDRRRSLDYTGLMLMSGKPWWLQILVGLAVQSVVAATSVIIIVFVLRNDVTHSQNDIQDINNSINNYRAEITDIKIEYNELKFRVDELEKDHDSWR